MSQHAFHYHWGPNNAARPLQLTSHWPQFSGNVFNMHHRAVGLHMSPLCPCPPPAVPHSPHNLCVSSIRQNEGFGLHLAVVRGHCGCGRCCQGEETVSVLVISCNGFLVVNYSSILVDKLGLQYSDSIDTADGQQQ
jgi:hypothetical protein